MGAAPPAMVTQATEVGLQFLRCYPWQRVVTWTSRRHLFHRSAPRCCEWQSTDTEEDSCTRRFITSSPRYTQPPPPSAQCNHSTENGHFCKCRFCFLHVTCQGEMKMPVCIEDECNPDLPPASLLFRSARQYAYGVLFSLAESQRRLERLAMRKRTPLEGKRVRVRHYQPSILTARRK